MVNLISNARHDMENMPGASQQITLCVELVAGISLRVAVRNEGEAVPVNTIKCIASRTNINAAGLAKTPA